MKPKLSIITSVLNAADVIDRTRSSLIPLPDGVEWIFIDGGSKDNTVEKIAPWVTPEVYSGCTLYGGFNHGLRHSTGEFVYFLNAGDTLLPEPPRRFTPYNATRLEYLRNEIDAADVYYFDTLLADGSTFPRHELYNLPLRMCFSHQGCVMRREVALELGGFSEYSGPAADHELLVKFWLRNNKMFSPLVLTLAQCAPFESTEDHTGRVLNRWRNVRNLYKIHRPEKLEWLDRTYHSML